MKRRERFTQTIKKLTVLLMLVLLGLNANAQKERLQTAFIYQLTRLIEWCPQGKEGNFTIGVLGNEPELLAELNALQGRRVGTQQIEVTTFSNVGSINTTNILFVPASQFGNIAQVSSKIGSSCTLILSDQPGSASKGAGISLVFNEGLSKLEFEIHKKYMETKSLSVNNQLYNLASRVY